MVRSFSISWKRNMFEVKLFCLSPSGKEHLTKLYFNEPEMEQLASSITKAIENYRKNLPPERDTNYIG